MSAPNAVERVCDVLETVLLNAPISFRELELGTGIERRILSRILVHLQEAGFVEKTNDGARVPGDRLLVILDGRRRGGYEVIQT